MTLRAATATVTMLLSAIFATAQQRVAQFTDPANLRGESVKPRDGRELPIDQGARGLEQMLRKLNTRASLMLIVAHPDDEDGGMLTYYSRGLGARVAVLTLTRGEGGQNAMTGDFEDALGLLRTQELLSADRYLGVDQFFGTEVDFGFSKTKEEAFKKWTHERVLYDAVRSIRLYRPLVIAAVFIGGVTDGHGQHQVSGQIAQEAFKAAADPTVFPDMIAEGILPWQALKVYARVPMQSISDKGLFDYATGKYTAPRFENYVTGEVTTTVPSSDVVVHEGTTDPILSDNPADPPRTYVQFARIGLGLQKSQVGSGMRVPPAGAFDVSYHRYGSKLANQPQHETSFFDGIDTSIMGMGTYSTAPLRRFHDVLENVSVRINAASENFDPDYSDDTATNLAVALRSVNNAISVVNEFTLESPYAKENILHELRIKRVQLNNALVLALGLQVQADIPANKHDGWLSSEVPTLCDVLPENDLTVRINLATASHLNFRVMREHLRTTFGKSVDSEIFILDGDDLPGIRFPKEGVYVRPLSVKVPTTAEPTKPYFYRSSIQQPSYELRNSTLRNAPTTPSPFVAWTDLTYNGADISLGKVVEDHIQPVQLVSSINVSVSPHAEVVSSLGKTFSISLTATPVEKLVGVSASFTGAGQSCCFVQAIAKPDHGYLPLTSTLTLPFEANRNITVDASAFDANRQTVSEGYRPIGYGDLPRTNYYTPATVRIVPVDLNLPSTHRIAYLPGTGDAVPESLASINLKPDILTVADLTPAKLSHYDTVILGVRTYNAHPDLHGAPTQALLDYARNGGNVLVQYQTAEFTAADAPYPLTLGYAAEKVVDETDPVQLLDTSAPFLTTPNKITPSDFDGWVEERGHSFLGSWDAHYTALTETHDPDQDPQRGGLITTPLGKGGWTYCAFALYRQLPEAVPGAYRLFVNLISPSTPK